MVNELSPEIEARNRFFKIRKADAILAMMVEGARKEYIFSELASKCGEKHGYGFAGDERYTALLEPHITNCINKGFITESDVKSTRLNQRTSTHSRKQYVLTKEGVDYYNNTLLPVLKAHFEQEGITAGLTPRLPSVATEDAERLGMMILGNPQLLELLTFSPHPPLQELLSELGINPRKQR